MQLQTGPLRMIIRLMSSKIGRRVWSNTLQLDREHESFNDAGLIISTDYKNQRRPFSKQLYKCYTKQLDEAVRSP